MEILAETIMAEESGGVYISPLGHHFVVERREDRMRRARLSREEPDGNLPEGWNVAILRCWPGGEEVPWDLLDLSGLTEFQREVLSFVASIPLGETLTYGQVADRLGRPKAARAVGSALGKNPFPLIIPCHRVVGSKGIGGYSSGVELKQKILDVEREICQR